MARTTDLEVLDLVEAGDNDIGWAIETANLVIDTHLASAGVAEPMLRRIEMFIAAHFTELAVTHGSVVRESTGLASANYANIYGEGFRSTRWGQQALALDYTGTLANLTNTKLKALLELV